MSLKHTLSIAASTLVLSAPGVASAGPTITKKDHPQEKRPLLCPAEKFWFDGACRDTAWVFQTFGAKKDAAHLKLLGGLGDRSRRDGNKLLLIEQFGGLRSPMGLITTYTLLKPTRAASGAKMPWSMKPSRGGYEIEKVVRRAYGFPGPQMTLRFHEVLSPTKKTHKGNLGPVVSYELSPTELKSVTTNYRNGHITLCDLGGCNEAIASMHWPDASQLCEDIVADLKNAGTFACDVGAVVTAGGLGCVGGGIAGVLTGGGGGGSISLGALTIPGGIAGGVAGCLGTGLLAGVATGLAADPACSRLTEVLIVDWLVKDVCVQAMKDKGAQPSPGGIKPPDEHKPTDGGSGQKGHPCSSEVVWEDVGFEDSNGDYCVADVEFSCSGTLSETGDCQFTGASPCGLTGLSAIACGEGAEIESGYKGPGPGKTLPSK